MSFITETLDEKLSVLIVSKRKISLINHLLVELKKYDVDIFFSTVLPKNIERFTYYFFVNEEIFPTKKILIGKKVTFLYINNTKKALECSHYYPNSDVKIISIEGDVVTHNHINKILWFSFSKTNEKLLQLTAVKKHVAKKPRFSFSQVKLPNKKTFLFLSMCFIFFLHIAFVLPLMVSSYFFYQSALSFNQEKLDRSSRQLNTAEPFLNIAKKLYTIPRSTLLLFSLSLLPDDIFDINEKADSSLKKLIVLQQNLGQTTELLFNKQKTSDEKRLLLLRLERIKEDINVLADNISTLSQKLPSFKPFQDRRNELVSASDLLTRLKKILPQLDSLLAKNTTKKYLLLFANNMELRPGGGFIGSFGLVTVHDYTIQEIRVYDVYDADGQLVAHVDPPDAIRRYLGQPHWFLRDSAFSPDFLENYIQAKYFLEKEMGFNDFAGSILITTSGIQNILGAFGDIYLPDFNEKINQKNFYLKAQLYAENKFFPGSIQKKNFLSSLVQYLMLNLNTVSYKELAKGLKKSLNEKQIIFYFDDPKLQEIINSSYWAGRTINPGCNSKEENCITDYIFPYDANLGVNKANFFVSRTYDLKISIDESGRINHTFTVHFENESLANVFPGGTYANYFQILLPKNAEVKQITKDGTLVENFDESSDQYKKIGTFLEIKPQTKTELKITYDMNGELPKGKNLYQLIAQKQIGAANSDFSMRFVLPKNTYSTNQNFSALVNNNQIIYNTSLSTDKIFFMELIRE